MQQHYERTPLGFLFHKEREWNCQNLNEMLLLCKMFALSPDRARTSASPRRPRTARKPKMFPIAMFFNCWCKGFRLFLISMQLHQRPCSFRTFYTIRLNLWEITDSLPSRSVHGASNVQLEVVAAIFVTSYQFFASKKVAIFQQPHQNAARYRLNLA